MTLLSLTVGNSAGLGNDLEAYQPYSLFRPIWMSRALIPFTKLSHVNTKVRCGSKWSSKGEKVSIALWSAERIPHPQFPTLRERFFGVTGVKGAMYLELNHLTLVGELVATLSFT